MSIQNLDEMEAQMKKKKNIYIYICHIMHHLAEPYALAHEVFAFIYTSVQPAQCAGSFYELENNQLKIGKGVDC